MVTSKVASGELSPPLELEGLLDFISIPIAASYHVIALQSISYFLVEKHFSIAIYPLMHHGQAYR
jgi:hypothetical protein